MQLARSTAPLPSGIGYRTPHYADLQGLRPAVGFLEVHAENVLAGGRRKVELFHLRRDWPVAIHGVGLSLGGLERPEEKHLERLATLVGDVEPMLVSEHLSFSRIDGAYLNDLLPLPMTEAALSIVCRNVDIVQTRLGRQILIENPSRYLSFKSSTMVEADFLNELARRTGCGVLLDLNNVYVTCANVGGDPRDWCDALNLKAVGEIHLAGHSTVEAEGETVLIDDHGSAVPEPVWRLFDYVIDGVPMTPVLVEWDSRIPDLQTLAAEAAKADVRRTGMLARSPYGPTGDVHHALAV